MTTGGVPGGPARAPDRGRRRARQRCSSTRGWRSRPAGQRDQRRRRTRSRVVERQVKRFTERRAGRQPRDEGLDDPGVAALPRVAAGRRCRRAAGRPGRRFALQRERQQRGAVCLAANRHPPPLSAGDAGARALPHLPGTPQVPQAALRGPDGDRLGQGGSETHLRGRPAHLSRGRPPPHSTPSSGAKPCSGSEIGGLAESIPGELECRAWQQHVIASNSGNCVIFPGFPADSHAVSKASGTPAVGIDRARRSGATSSGSPRKPAGRPDPRQQGRHLPRHQRSRACRCSARSRWSRSSAPR